MPAKKGKPGDEYFREIRASLDMMETRYKKVARATTGKKHAEAVHTRDSLQDIAEVIRYEMWKIVDNYGGDE